MSTLTKEQKKRIYIFINGGCVDAVTDGEGNELGNLGDVCIIDYDESSTENICPICRQEYDSESDEKCPTCGYDAKVGTITEALRAAHEMENRKDHGFDLATSHLPEIPETDEQE